MPEIINIEWTREQPPLTPVTWQGFDEVDFTKHGDLDVRYGLPLGAVSSLEYAFAKNMPRSTGWSIADASSFSEGLTVAASIYKRGVALKNRGDYETSINKGNYDIAIFDSTDQIDLSDASQFYVIDANVLSSWPDLAKLSPAFIYHAEETNKTMSFVAQMIQEWNRCGKPSEWTIVGGGITSDVAGFAAHLSKANTTLVPTTLLAMVDASVGGKVGVNYPPYGKNQIGSFHFPSRIAMNTKFLTTLPERHFKGGLSEALKHAMIGGDDLLFDSLVRASFDLDRSGLSKMVAEIVSVKANVVELDPMERGVRKVLNLGHTLAHALEARSQKVIKRAAGSDVISHGEAVAIGLIYAAGLSKELGYLPVERYDYWTKGLLDSRCVLGSRGIASALGINVEKLADEWNYLFTLMMQDKKMPSATSGAKREVQFVLPLDGSMLGRDEEEWFVGIDESVMRKCWDDLIEVCKKLA